MEDLAQLVKSYAMITGKKLSDVDAITWIKIVKMNLAKYSIDLKSELLESTLFDLSHRNMLNPADFVLTVICKDDFTSMYKRFCRALHDSMTKNIIIDDDDLIVEAYVRSGFSRHQFFDINYYGEMKFDDVKTEYLKLDPNQKYNNFIQSFTYTKSEPLHYKVKNSSTNLLCA